MRIPFGDSDYHVDSNQLKRYEAHMSPRHPCSVTIAHLTSTHIRGVPLAFVTRSLLIPTTKTELRTGRRGQGRGRDGGVAHCGALGGVGTGQGEGCREGRVWQTLPATSFNALSTLVS